jgi:hypothetical protein
MKKKEKKIREKVGLSKKILHALIKHYGEDGDIEGWRFIDDKIIGGDPEDGGSEHLSIILRIEDEKYFRFEWCDWDRKKGHDGGSFFNKTYEVEEVFPKLVTITVYG